MVLFLRKLYYHARLSNVTFHGVTIDLTSIVT